MHSKKGGYMNVYTAQEQKQAESKGWVVVDETPPVVKPVVKKTRRKRIKK